MFTFKVVPHHGSQCNLKGATFTIKAKDLHFQLVHTFHSSASNLWVQINLHFPFNLQVTTAPFYCPCNEFFCTAHISLQLILPSYWKQPLATTNQLETSLFLSWPWPVSRPVQLVFSNPQQSLFGVSGQFGWRTYYFVSVFHLIRHCAEHPVPYYGFHVTKIPVSNDYIILICCSCTP